MEEEEGMGKLNCEWGLCVGEGTDWQSASGGACFSQVILA